MSTASTASTTSATKQPPTALFDVLCASVSMHSGKKTQNRQGLHPTISLTHPPFPLFFLALGLVLFASNKEEEAGHTFQTTLVSISHLLPTTPTTTTTTIATNAAALVYDDDTHSLIRNVAITTVNNLSVCLFHTGTF